MQKKVIILQKKIELKKVATMATCCSQGPQSVR